jgi:hypothetical protein
MFSDFEEHHESKATWRQLSWLHSVILLVLLLMLTRNEPGIVQNCSRDGKYEGCPQSKFPARPTGSKPYITRSDCMYVIEQWRSMAPALTALLAFSQYQCYSCWRWRLLFQLPPTVKCGQW